MAYIFKKTIDTNNKFDNTEVTVEMPHNEVTLPEILEVFEDFLKGCGFTLMGPLEIEENVKD